VTVFDVLRQTIPAAQVAADVRSILTEANWRVELDGRDVNAATDVFEVVARSCHAYDRAMHFGDHYSVLVAIGGVDRMAHGVPEAAICFARLYYTPSLALITVDFSRTVS
jgi:hypothetical protein